MKDSRLPNMAQNTNLDMAEMLEDVWVKSEQVNGLNYEENKPRTRWIVTDSEFISEIRKFLVAWYFISLKPTTKSYHY